MEPHRCPACQALVVDRRSATCTTCRVELPKDWVMTPEQIRKVTAIDQSARAEFNHAMEDLRTGYPGTGADNPIL